VSRKQNFPYVHASGYSDEAEAGFNAATGGIVQISKILQNAGDLWVAYHQRLMLQGYTPLDATNYLLKQKWLQQVQAQPQPQPAPQPFPSPFQAPMNNGGPRANP
jgi:hypothetical protein